MDGSGFKDRLIFDTSDPATSDNVGSYLRSSDGTLITHTTVGGDEALDVNIVNAITVDVDLDGVFSGGNADPDNVGLISHVRAAAPADADQTVRTTAGNPADAIVNANIFGIDVNSMLHGFNGATYDRLTTSSGALDMNIQSQDSPLEVVGNIADDIADAGNPIKVGLKTFDAILTEVSTVGDRADMIGDMYRRLYVNDSANIAYQPAQFTTDISATVVQLDTVPLSGRKKIRIQNFCNKDVFLVEDAGDTVAASRLKGERIARGASYTESVGEHVPLFVVGDAGINGGTIDIRLGQYA